MTTLLWKGGRKERPKKTTLHMLHHILQCTNYICIKLFIVVVTYAMERRQCSCLPSFDTKENSCACFHPCHVSILLYVVPYMKQIFEKNVSLSYWCFGGLTQAHKDRFATLEPNTVYQYFKVSSRHSKFCALPHPFSDKAMHPPHPFLDFSNYDFCFCVACYKHGRHHMETVFRLYMLKAYANGISE